MNVNAAVVVLRILSHPGGGCSATKCPCTALFIGRLPNLSHHSLLGKHEGRTQLQNLLLLLLLPPPPPPLLLLLLLLLLLQR